MAKRETATRAAPRRAATVDRGETLAEAQIIMNTSIAGNRWAAAAGDTVTVSKAEARRLVAAGHARYPTAA